MLSATFAEAHICSDRWYIVKTVNVLTAIRWIKKAWEAVQPQLFPPQDGETESDENLLADIEDEYMSSLDELVHQATCSVKTSCFIFIP